MNRSKSRYNLNPIVPWFQAMRDSTEVDIAPDLMRMRPKIDPEKWPIEGPPILLSNLKVDVPEFVPGQAYYPSRLTGTSIHIYIREGLLNG